MRLHLVDGTYELFRAHYAPRPDHYAPSGRDAKATVGIVESLLALLHDANEAVTHIAVVFDNPIRSFRNDLFPQYKSDEGVPPELRSQFDAAEEAVRSIGVTIWSMREYEADDGLASGARWFGDQVDEVRILSPDKDLGQCLQVDRVVQSDPGEAGSGDRMVEIDARRGRTVGDRMTKIEPSQGTVKGEMGHGRTVDDPMAKIEPNQGMVKVDTGHGRIVGDRMTKIEPSQGAVKGDTGHGRIVGDRMAKVEPSQGKVEVEPSQGEVAGGREVQVDAGPRVGAGERVSQVDRREGAGTGERGIEIVGRQKKLGRVVQVDRRQRKVTDEAAFRAERGFGPRSMPDFLALVGDSADGIPGLRGFGKKSASMLLGVYEHLERIPADASRWTVTPRGAAQLAATLVEHRDDALLYRKLATLVDTVPIAESLEDLRFRGVPRERFMRWCDELGVARLKTVPRRWQ
jgi:5'-3' exonuclease